VETLVLKDAPNGVGFQELGIGNNSDNKIYGNAAANDLQGLDGNDFLFGDAGDDTLYGVTATTFLTVAQAGTTCGAVMAMTCSGLLLQTAAIRWPLRCGAQAIRKRLQREDSFARSSARLASFS
jgi:Ca2+-binding RTX toxin-like protein